MFNKTYTSRIAKSKYNDSNTTFKSYFQENQGYSQNNFQVYLKDALSGTYHTESEKRPGIETKKNPPHDVYTVINLLTVPSARSNIFITLHPWLAPCVQLHKLHAVR